MHKLKHKHTLKHCSLRLVAVPTAVLVWSAEDTFHLLNRFTLSVTAICDHRSECTKLQCFPEKFTSTPMGRTTPRILPHRGLWSLGTLRLQVWTSSYAYDSGSIRQPRYHTPRANVSLYNLLIFCCSTKSEVTIWLEFCTCHHHFHHPYSTKIRNNSIPVPRLSLSFPCPGKLPLTECKLTPSSCCLISVCRQTHRQKRSFSL